jgi:DNA primase
MTEVLSAVSPYLKKIKPSGNENIMAICPFHRKADGSEERGASFAMNKNSGLWFCHSCKACGNLYTFLRGIGFSHARLTSEYQYVLDEAAKHHEPAPDPLRPISPVADNVEPLREGFLGLFNYYPQLMADEGFPPDLCQRFGIGYDELHNRVTFPLRDLAGRLVGISGRSTVNAKPRYKVYSTEYLDFGLDARDTQKRALIWNGHEALVELAQMPVHLRRIIVVEGFKAAMRVAQADVGPVIATLGSYLSKEQQWFLEGTGATVYLMPDHDEPGMSGCIQAANQLDGHVAGLRIVEYENLQPSDLSPEEVATAVASAKPFNLWLCQQLKPIDQ